MLRIVIWISLPALLLVTACQKKRGGSEDLEPSRSELPVGWRVAPSSPLRKASFMVKGSGGAVADISLVVQSGRAGGLLNHINSWRTQLGHTTLDRLKFEQAAEWITLPIGEAVLVDIEGATDKKNQLYDGRLVAAVVEKPEETWFFKMRGNSKLVETQKIAFLNWISTVKPTHSDEDISSMNSGMPTRESSTPAELINPFARENPPQWQLPESWTQIPAPPRHYATFSLQGPDGHSGHVFVTLLDGDGGGTSAIVNRQRAELGMTAITKENSAAMVQSLWSAHASMSMVRLASPRGSMVAAWVTGRKEGAWLFQLRGPTVVVKRQKPNFAMFLQSITFTAE